jgi:hypothetical protein
LHIDNAKSHNSRLSIRKTEEYGFIRVPQPHYSPDLAPCDFFLFGYLKSQLEGKTFFDENDVKGEMRRILTEIPVNLFHSVMVSGLAGWSNTLNWPESTCHNYYKRNLMT